MANVYISSAGTSGPRGSSWLSGTGVPASTVGFDGDFYLDTTNVGFYYGPKTAGVWGTAHPFGNSLNGVPLTNVTAVVGPTANNDSSQGYSAGSLWIDTVKNLTYTCVKATVGTAVWVQALPAGPTNSSIQVTGTPSFGEVLVAQSANTASWEPNPYLFGTTGVAYGAQMSFHAGQPTQFDIAAGVGYIIDNVTTPLTPTVNKVVINAQTVNVATFPGSPAPITRTVNWWLMDANGVITVQGTTPDNVTRRQKLVLGVTGSNIGTGVLFNVQTLPVILNQPENQLYDLMYSLGPFNVSGNQVSANGANLQFNKTVGTEFSASFGAVDTPNNPHIANNPPETPCSFRYATRVSGSQGNLITTIDPTSYDLNGVVTPVPNPTSSTTIQRIWLFGTEVATAQLAVQYGQTVYANLSAGLSAVGNANYVVNPDFSGIAVLIARIVIQKNCLSLLDTTTSAIVPAAKFAVP